MKIELNNLPNQPDVLHQIILSLNSEIESLLSENTSLRERLKLLRARRYGKSSEKIDSQIEQLELWLEENDTEEESEDKTEVGDGVLSGSNLKSENNPKKKKAGRCKLPEDLPREDKLLYPEPKCPSCGGEDFRKISDDISETLEYVPASFKVIRYIRPRCACINCEKIVQAYAPSKTIDKGKAGSGLLAHILVQKYCNHLPLYRQSQIYEREGIEISRSTMSGWAKQCSKLLQPVVDELQKSVFASSHLHGDDTPVKVLAPGLKKTKTGRIWSYVRDGRPYGDDTPPAVCYFYSPDRKGERPAKHLEQFNGTLHADAYAGYNQLYASEDNPNASITEAACWAHTRRKFYEITVASDNAKIAINALEEIGKLYKIEAAIRGLKPDKRLEYRKQKSKAIVQNLFVSLQKSYNKLPKKSTTAKAISYAMNNKTALMRFLEDGKIEIDNNAAERSMRSIAVGRKNWLFAGSDNGGHTAANIYSLIETAKLNNLNPWKYLHKVLDTIQDHNSQKLAELLPWNINLD